MKRILAIALLAAMLAPGFAPSPVEAGSKSKYSKKRYNKSTGKRRTRVHGYRARRGHYSYSANDVINTYGNSRTRYGSVNSYRDPFTDRQTSAGPFDHGWFFDSAVAPRGGDSPYMQ